MLSAKQIEIFYEVYKQGSMTAAAEGLQISQPSISKTLGVIEKKLNFKLFLRQGKKLIYCNYYNYNKGTISQKMKHMVKRQWI